MKINKKIWLLWLNDRTFLFLELRIFCDILCEYVNFSLFFKELVTNHPINEVSGYSILFACFGGTGD
jgi:hypothetical protein